MRLLTRTIAMILLAAALVACAATPTPTPTTAPATTPTVASTPTSASTPTVAAATPSPAAAVTPSPAATPTVMASTAATPAATPQRTNTPTAATPGAATPGALPALKPGEVRYVIVPENSEARFRVKEQLASASLPNDAVGSTKDVSGQIVVDSAGRIVKESSRITVKLADLTSDQSRRDNFIKQNTLETSRYPEVVFVPTEARGLASPLPTSGEVKFDLVGDLTVRDVTKPTTWKVEATVQGDDVRGKAETAVTFGDFGMSQPRVALVLSVEDNIRLEIDFHLRRSAS